MFEKESAAERGSFLKRHETTAGDARGGSVVAEDVAAAQFRDGLAAVDVATGD